MTTPAVPGLPLAPAQIREDPPHTLAHIPIHTAAATEDLGDYDHVRVRLCRVPHVDADVGAWCVGVHVGGPKKEREIALAPEYALGAAALLAMAARRVEMTQPNKEYCGRMRGHSLAGVDVLNVIAEHPCVWISARIGAAPLTNVGAWALALVLEKAAELARVRERDRVAGLTV